MLLRFANSFVNSGAAMSEVAASSGAQNDFVRLVRDYLQAKRAAGASPRTVGHYREVSNTWVGPFHDSLAAKCSAMGVPANFSPNRREKSSSELRGR